MATTNKNFRIKNGLEVSNAIGVGADGTSFGTAGQVLSSNGTSSPAIWVDQTSLSSSTVKHQVKLGEAIAKGQAVYVSTATGANMIVSKASNATEATSSKTMGLLETGGVLNDQVNVITEGMLDNIDVGSASAGDPVWLGTSGNLIYGLTNKPIAPAHLVFIGIVTKEGTAGRIFIRVQNGFELNELHTVLIGTDYSSVPADNNILAYDLASSLWKNQTAEQAGVANLSGATFTGNVAGTNLSLSGDANVAGKLSVTAKSGDEGGEIFLSNAATNTVITNGVTIDVYQNKLRFFEQGGDARGFFINVAAGGAGASTNLVGGGSGDGNTTYNISAVTTTGGSLLRLTSVDPSGTDDVKFAGSGATTVAFTDANTITISSTDTTYTNGTGLTLTGNSFSVTSNTYQPIDADLTAIAALANSAGYLYNNGTGTFTYNSLGTNVSTFLATPNSLNLLNTVLDETGSGSLVFATSPVLTTPNIGAAIGTSLNVTANLNASTLRLTSIDEVTTGSTTHAFQIGPDAGARLAIDVNEVHALNGASFATLLLNESGGDVNVGASTSTVTIAGNTQLGLAEKQIQYNTGVAGSSTAGGYVYANNTHYINVASSNYFSNITTQRIYPTGWSHITYGQGTTASANTLTVSSIFTSAQEGDIVVIFASTENAAYPTAPGDWNAQTSGSTGSAATLFWKRMGSTPDTSVVLSFAGSTTPSSYVAKRFRPTGITPSLSTAVVTVQTTAWSVGSTAPLATFAPNPAAVSSVYPNALAVTAISVENIATPSSVTVPTGYDNTVNTGLTDIASFTSNTLASYSAMTWKTTPISTAGTSEDASAWSITPIQNATASGGAVYSATTFLIQAYVDPTISIVNNSFLSSGSYNSSTYVLHINNAENRTVTWSGPTFAWQGGSAPTLSSSAPNNIVILETINGTTFRGALLDSYA